MISKVHIQNFKSLRDVTVYLGRFTVFVGTNGSGKTSVLQSLDMLCRAFRPSPPNPNQSWEGVFQDRLSRGSLGVVEVSAECGGKRYRYRTQNSLSTPGGPGGPGGVQWDGSGVGASGDLKSDSWSAWPTNPMPPSPLPQSVLLQLETSKLIRGDTVPPDPTVMNADGTNLHAALAGMALSEQDTFVALQQHLKQIIPTVRRVRHTKKGELLFDMVGADSLPANQVSEGTLLVLGVLAALYGTARPALILLDDLDRGLHPLAQKELVGLLRGLLDTTPDLQLAATTHSPYLLNYLDPGQVRLTALREDGSTVCGKLADHPNFAKWKEEFSPGEMWSVFGEKWLAEKGAAA